MEPSSESGAAPGDRKKKGASEGVDGRAQQRPEDQVVQPRPPQGWPRKLLFFFPAALFIFLIGVLLWGILSDLLAGYR